MKIEVEREDDGRWIAEIPDLPGVMSYGQTRKEAVPKAKALGSRVLTERLEAAERSIEEGRGIPQEEVKQRLPKWLN
jgi:predicted RNase H-like HicB family nuclease